MQAATLVILALFQIVDPVNDPELIRLLDLSKPMGIDECLDNARIVNEDAAPYIAACLPVLADEHSEVRP